MTALADAARETVAARDALDVPYVPTATNAPSVRDVMASRRARLDRAIDGLRVAVAAASWPSAWQDPAGKVHRLRADFRVACLGPDDERDLFARHDRAGDTAGLLTVDNACADCDWGLA